MDSNKLLAGPFLGEFGWELFAWQGVLRKMVEVGDYNEVVIGCKSGREYLYRDFATKFINIEGDDGMADVCTYNRVPPLFSADILAAHSDHQIFTPHLDHYYKREQSFVKFGNKLEKGYDILVHARNRTVAPYRNWSIDNWSSLIKKFGDFSIASIGSKNNSHLIDGTDDLRGIPLNELCDYMASAYVMATPSSGPGHLASLCGCRHVVWTDNKKRSINADLFTNRDRYEHMWNPLKTKVVVIDDQEWNPSADSVYHAMTRLIRNG